MQPYKVNTFFVCQITGAVVTEISYTLNGEDHVYLKNLSSLENATNYIRGEKKTWLLTTLEKFLHHKKHIIEANSDAAKKNSLDLCFNALQKYQAFTIIDICKAILKGKTHFENVLPGNTNPSYENSTKILTAVIAFCEAEVK